jgi:hypothetical protein
MYTQLTQMHTGVQRPKKMLAISIDNGTVREQLLC